MSAIPVDRMRADRVGPPQLPNVQKPTAKQQASEPTFADHLKKACEDAGCRTRFSGHAQSRVINREITLAPEQLARIDKAIDSVADKGAKKALVMLDDMALIVGIEKRTVVTLVDQPSLRDNVFTKIDAAVIA